MSRKSICSAARKYQIQSIDGKLMCTAYFIFTTRQGWAKMILTVTSEGLKRNCLLRLDFSMVSMSVTMTTPSPLASPIMAKFFSSSQPMAPAPTWNDKAPVWVNYPSFIECFQCLLSKLYPFFSETKWCNVYGMRGIHSLHVHFLSGFMKLTWCEGSCSTLNIASGVFISQLRLLGHSGSKLHALCLLCRLLDVKKINIRLKLIFTY